MRVVLAPELTSAQFESALALVQRDERALDPAVEPMTAEELRRLITDDRAQGNIHIRLAAVDDDDRVRTFVHFELEDDESNPHFSSAEIWGAADDPEAGRAAVRAMLDLPAAAGRTTLLGWGPNTAAEHAFWTGVGTTLRYTERMSALDVIAVDAALMQAWIDQRADRAADITLVQWTDACPAEHLAAFAVSCTTMNDAPRDDIEINDHQVEVDEIREDEDARRALGMQALTLLAVDPDGRPAGHTQISVNPFRPNASWQGDTGVLPDHRQRGIGRWLKAAMWQRLRAEAPQVERILTANAESNAAMLAINVAMGFREAYGCAAWQGDTADVRAALDASSSV